MLPYRDVPFPRAEVRDLVGLLRAMHREAKARGDVALVKRIESAGTKLSKALELEREFRGRERTMGHRSAWKHAEDGALEAGEIVDDLYPVKPVIKATAKRISPCR